MKSKNKKKIIILGVIFTFLLIGIALFFSSSQSIVNIQLGENGYATEPLQTGIFTFQGTEGTYETTWLGSLSSHGGDGTVLIDGDSDGERIISNSIDSGSRLKLSSSNQIVSSSQGSTNYIQTKILLPPGKITASYDYSVTDYYGDVASVSFVINEETKTFKTPWFHTYERGGSVQGSDTYEFELTESQEVIFKVETTTSKKNENAIGNLEIDFTPRPQQITYFRLSDNTCQEIQLIPSEKTENDYLTLSECESHIKHYKIYIIIGSIALVLIFLIIFLNKQLHKRK